MEFIMKINHCEGHQKNISLFVHAHMIEYKSHKEFPFTISYLPTIGNERWSGMKALSTVLSAFNIRGLNSA